MEWDFQGLTGDCSPGKFVANSANSATTTLVMLAGMNKAGSDVSVYLKNIQPGSLMSFRIGGEVVTFTVSAIVPEEEPVGCMNIALSNPSHTSWDWYGTYVISFDAT